MRFLFQTAAVVFAVAGLSGACQAQPASVRDDARCLDWGAERGTPAYYDCRKRLEYERRRRHREESEEYEGPPPDSYGGPPPGGYGPPPGGGYGPPHGPGPAARDEISDDAALAQCERRARYGAPFPIAGVAAKFVAPGREKLVTMSFQVVKPGPAYGFWNVECRFSRGQMTSFKGR